MNGAVDNNYIFDLVDPFIPLNQKLAGSMEFYNTGYAYNLQNSKEQELKGLQRAIALREVVIKGKKDETITCSANACGDYVCYLGFLNCPLHRYDPRNHPPVNNTEYLLIPDKSQLNPKKIWYWGCNADKYAHPFRGIYTAQEFYGVNTGPDGLLEQQYLSTLFWKPGLLVNGKGEADCSFYTGDITGKFRIVVQGVSGDHMIYGSGSFMVK